MKKMSSFSSKDPTHLRVCRGMIPYFQRHMSFHAGGQTKSFGNFCFASYNGKNVLPSFWPTAEKNRGMSVARGMVRDLPGMAKGVESKFRIEELLGIEINCVRRFRERSGLKA